MVFITNIEKDTITNNNYRNVIHTEYNIQLVLMSLKPGEEIGMEVHNNIDQFFRIESGIGIAEIKENNNNITNYSINDGCILIVPKGTYHNIKNISPNKDLKLYTIYSPPNHKDKLIQINKGPDLKDDIFNVKDLDLDYKKKYEKYKNKYLNLKKLNSKS